MQRRSFLAGAAAALPAARAFAQTGKASVLRYVPQADLTVIDPVMTTAYITRFHATMVWDQLYGIDHTLTPQPQMVQGHTVEDGGKLYTFTLRDGLMFHDKTPVRGRDCIASIKRWAARDPMGQALMARVDEMGAPDDKRFTIRLKRPFALVLNCLAKIGPPALVIMPERLANTDPFTAITEIVGSGPFTFVASERVVGSRVVYAKNKDYVPRPSGTVDWLAGPKIVHFDRVEWVVIPDPATAAGALTEGEVDWWENPQNDILPLLQKASGVRTELGTPLGNIGTGIFNHLYPPFDKPAVRKVVLQAMSQADFMTAAAGTDPKMWKDGIGTFAPGTPMASSKGLSVLSAPKPGLPALKKALVDAGYKGEKIVFMAPSDQAALFGMCAVAQDMLQKIGMNVDYAVMDWGTLVQRRASKSPPDKGGWNMFITSWAGIDMTTPITNQPLRSNGDKAWFGWPNLPPVQQGIEAWLEAPNLAAQQTIAGDIQEKALDLLPYLPLGQYFYDTACRTNITGIIPGQFVFWNVRRT
ncbi:MAG TPA: ABC transporter substrate-binding protein [Rhodopila sp.]|uniref:ABC transporter substrate-binding protein n=1 Tax=Rhodopila sp. TaxID=2480087 RepID=UPI002BA985B9|nr:ABC transporter substrate-binding protein [Rhodopila sp.]HVY14725.1 ABC transporter substrate-binding protein [Rhodopila sp.]